MIEEEAPITAAPVVEATKAVDPLPIVEEAPVLPPVRGRVRRPQTPERVEEEVVVAPVVNRRGSQRQVKHLQFDISNYREKPKI